MAAKEPDRDDLPVVNYRLAQPYRLFQLATGDKQAILIEEVHAFLWLERCWFKYKAAPIRMQTARLLGEWLKSAKFDDEAIC